MRAGLIREGLWLTINLIVAGIFLWLSCRMWIEPPPGIRPSLPGGDPAAFSRLVVQFLGPVTLFNLAWMALAAWWRLRRKDWTPVWTFTALGFLWTGLLVYSASRVGN